MSVPLDCEFAHWGDWDECECSGTRQRYRPIAQRAKFGGRLCRGSQRLIQPCAPESESCRASLPIDCDLADWREWSACTRTCKSGQQDRSREILQQPLNGGKACDGDLGQTRVCNEQDCPGEEPVDCQWAQWTEWSRCSKTCGGGEKHRTRVVAVAAKFGGRLCEAATSAEAADCATKPCDPTAADCRWSVWDPWSSCSQTCGGGEMYRTRSIAREMKPGGAGCSGVFEDFGPCNQEKCPPSGQDCLFGDWLQWSACSATCQGHHSRTRAIAVQAHAGGTPCKGVTMEVNPCNEDLQCKELDVDCDFTTWAQWSPCSQSCSGGNKMRRREIGAHAKGHGAQCDADLQELSTCNTQPCSDLVPLDCEWSHWSDWSMCTATCGLGQFRRHRSVVVEARNGGRACEDGPMIEMGTCKLDPCVEMESVCEWAAWGQWTDCERAGGAVTCGGGQQKRSRTSKLTKESIDQGLVPSDSVGSDTQDRRLAWTTQPVMWHRQLSDMKCQELQDDVRPCGMVACSKSRPIDCMWAAWSMWSSCPCVGVKERHRVIASYAEGGGTPCDGPEVEASPCQANCEKVFSQDCEFDDWTAWSGCPVTCGGGVDDDVARVRYRTIKNYPRGNGLPCKGKTKELQPCNLDPCPDKLDCRWGQWSAYSACSVSCGGGQKSRSRIVEQVAEQGGKPCNRTVSMMVTPCNTQECPTEARDCEFSPWGDWEDCSVPCGGGEQHRSRTILVEATMDGALCNGLKQHFRVCNMKACESGDPKVPCVWDTWTSWSACTSLCNGHQERSRAVSQFASNGGPPCDGGERVVRACNTGSATCIANMPKDCVFSDWSEWSTCSHACDGGQTSRSREIQTQAQNFGKPCAGVLFQTQSCNTQACPGNEPVDCMWGIWGDWSACSKTCGGGQFARHRAIDTEPAAGGRQCDARSAMETGPCNIAACYGSFQVCGWSDWGDWVACSTTCGGGQRDRVRQKRWVPKAGGENAHDVPHTSRRLFGAPTEPNQNNCIGSQKETSPCGLEPCTGVTAPVSCQWGEWAEWGACSCQGLKEHERGVHVHAQNGGLACVGPMRATTRCTPPSTCEEMHKDCELSLWSEWSECTQTCGGGQRYHTRSIKSDSQAHGIGCQGSLEAVEPCNTQSCEHAVDCKYTNWSPWSTCSQSCDGGQRLRSRAIAEPASQGGSACQEAPLEQMDICGTHPCIAGTPTRVDCAWTLWSEWSACSTSCGVGLSSRSRGVLMEADHGGRPCDGFFKEIRNCTSEPCNPSSTNCQWSKWSAWSECAQPCSGNQERSRDIALEAQGSGSLCEGPAMEMRSCQGSTGECGGSAGDDDCRLSPWSEWSSCSQSCSGGQQTATRVVMQEAKRDGKPCKGSLSLMVPCNTAPCPGDEPVDCAWDNWGSWSACPVTCDGGEKKRHRTVRLEAKRGGKPCNTSSTTQVAKCNTQPCTEPEYCVWASWSSWAPCSATCDGGEKKRQRALVDLAIARQEAAADPTPLQLEEEAAGARSSPQEAADRAADDPLAGLLLRHRLQVCVLAAVGALSFTWIALQGMHQGHALVRWRQRRGRDAVPYVALATEDPATIGERDDELPAIIARLEMMR